MYDYGLQEPHTLKFDGQWHYRKVGSHRWIPLSHAPVKGYLWKKKGKYYTYRYLDREYSYRYGSQYEQEYYKGHLTYSAARDVAQWYLDRERNYTVKYHDPVRGMGILVVNSMGIIDRTVTEFEFNR